MIRYLWVILAIMISANDQYIILANKDNVLNEDYVPSDLIEINVDFHNSNIERKYLRNEAAVQIKEMFDDAKKENINLVAISGYRSYESQIYIYKYNVNTFGKEYSNKYVAKPGASEHQTGLAMDISCKSINYQLINEFKDTPEGKWLKDNCYKYGFIIRYPNGKEGVTGYEYEPWHIRYVGKFVSKYIYKNNITLEEYVKLANF